MNRMRPSSGSTPTADPHEEVTELSRRLRISGLPHILVDRLLGRTRLGSLYLAVDGRTDRPVTVKLIDADLAYDVGAADYLRGVGNAEETRSPHLLEQGRAAKHRATLCYISIYVPGRTLREVLEGDGPLAASEALRIASEMAGAVGYWHSRDEAHGAIDPDVVLLQSGQVVVVPPRHSLQGAQARRLDVRAVASLALALWQRTAPSPAITERCSAQLESLGTSADPDELTLLSMDQLQEVLRQVGEMADRPPRRPLLHRIFGRS